MERAEGAEAHTCVSVRGPARCTPSAEASRGRPPGRKADVCRVSSLLVKQRLSLFFLFVCFF